MMQWENVKQLHLEISSLCNSVCPACPRYPTHGYEALPHINNSWKWNIEHLMTNLPQSDIKHIEYFLINGSHGDFLTNPDALKIIDYLAASAPNAKIEINTNAGARDTKFWHSLGSLLKGKKANLFVAIDGLADTHSIYRRNTDWHKVIENSKAFIAAGGNAIWTMTKFEFNKHQIDACKKLSSEYGFSGFRLRDNNRPNLTIRSGDSIMLVNSEAIDEPNNGHDSSKILSVLLDRQRLIDNGTFKAVPKFIKKFPIYDTSVCESITNSSIYISGEWVVSPCCHIGGVISSRNVSGYYENVLSNASNHLVDIAELIATPTNTVKQIVNNNINWIFEALPSTHVLDACAVMCGSRLGASLTDVTLTH